MKKYLTGAFLLGVVAFGAPASAQEEDVQTKYYDFNDMLIDGEFRRPEGMFTTERGRARFESLLDLRRSFMDEIEQSAQEGALE